MRRCVDWIETTKSSEVCFWMTYEMEVFVTVALLQVVSMVEGMQRSTTMLSVTGYVTLALAGASQGFLPEFWLENR